MEKAIEGTKSMILEELISLQSKLFEAGYKEELKGRDEELVLESEDDGLDEEEDESQEDEVVVVVDDDDDDDEEECQSSLTSVEGV